MTEQPVTSKADSGKPDRNDAVAAAGAVLVVVGIALWSVPAAVIAAGLGLLFLGIAGARRNARIPGKPADPDPGRPDAG